MSSREGSSSFSTPPSSLSKSLMSSSRAAPAKRDSLMAELERDPQHSAAKRQQRAQVFTSHMAHASLERQLLAAQTAKMELETKVRDKDIQIDRLERDRRFFADREKEEREEKEKEREEREEEKRKVDADLRATRNALSTLREQYADLEEAHSSLSRSTSQTIASQKSQLITFSRQSSVLEEELSEFKRIANERSVTIQDLQDQVERASVTQETFTRKNVEDETWGVVREELSRQAEYLRSLESANSKLTAEVTVLRERHASIEVLREEKRGLERKVSVMEELREKIVKLEAQVEAARREREEWAHKANNTSTPTQTPVSVTQNLSTLRLTYARLYEEHGTNVALLRRREAEIQDTEQRISEAIGSIDTLKAEAQALKEKVTRREQRTMLAEREVGFLQALVASFTAEQASQETEISNEANEALLQQFQRQGELLKAYKAANNTLQITIDTLDSDTSTVGNKRSRKDLMEEIEKRKATIQESQKALEDAKEVSEKHLERIEELEQTLFELRGKIGTGNHVPPGMRVLCLRDNPAQQWSDLRQEIMDRLKNENSALIKRLKELEENGASSDQSTERRQGEELVPRESWEVVNKEKKELEDVVKQKEKRLLRLQQVFTAKSTEFRETIASILGLKLAFYPNGQVRVTSIYDLSASFVFQPLSKSTPEGEGARMQLVAQGEGGPQDLPQLMRFWVEQEQCIPGFLASVTLECYDKSKRENGDNP